MIPSQLAPRVLAACVGRHFMVARQIRFARRSRRSNVEVDALPISTMRSASSYIG